jgi:hypothetical protein
MIIILSEKHQLPLNVGSFIVSTYRNQPSAYMRGSVAVGSEK